MNSVSNSTRVRLPSVQSVFGPIEQYQVDRDKRGPFSGKHAVELEPLDVYLAHLFLNVYPGQPAILDLAAEATSGASTLIGLLHPRQPSVRAPGGPLPGDRLAYRPLVEEFLERQGKDLTLLQWLPNAGPVIDVQRESDPVIFVVGIESSVVNEVESWLNVLPSAVVLLFGLGPVGDSAALDALLRRFPTGSTRRLRLLRESGETLSTSRLGMVAERDNAAAEAALRRLRQLFTSNYTFLGLLRSVTEKAIHASGSDAVVRESDGSFLEWNHEINQLKKAAQQTRENAAAAEELNVLKGRLSYRLCEQVCRWRERLAPDDSRRYRLLRLLRRIFHRCLRRNASVQAKP